MKFDEEDPGMFEVEPPRRVLSKKIITIGVILFLLSGVTLAAVLIRLSNPVSAKVKLEQPLISYIAHNFSLSTISGQDLSQVTKFGGETIKITILNRNRADAVIPGRVNISFNHTGNALTEVLFAEYSLLQGWDPVNISAQCTGTDKKWDATLNKCFYKFNPKVKYWVINESWNPFENKYYWVAFVLNTTANGTYAIKSEIYPR